MDDKYLNNEYKDVSVWEDYECFPFFLCISADWCSWIQSGFIEAAYQFYENISMNSCSVVTFAGGGEYMTKCW